MFKDFESFIEKNSLFDTSQKIILAVSGGVDSMVLAFLFHKAGFNFGIAHCNFALRGQEADLDETLVKKTAEKYKVSFYCKKFDTKKYAKDNKISIQMAARELRYTWFNELYQEKYCDLIALAHHKNDSAETFLINLIRGTGISGLHGIKAKNNIFIRPLLFCNKTRIENYAKNHKIDFRNDMSNFEDKYTRNKLRNKIIPLLENINPVVVDSLCDTAAHLTDVEIIYQQAIDKYKNEIMSKRGLHTIINLTRLKEIEGFHALLYEILSPYGFNTSQIKDIYIALEGISGKVFYSPTFKLLKDREELIIEELENKGNKPLLINKNDSLIKSEGLSLSLSTFEKTAIFKPFSASPKTVFLDYNKLEFPLILRKWQKGDCFVPLGMKTKKKVSDFLIDNKLNLFEKENLHLLFSGEKAVWIVGMRADERFKITSETKQVLKIEIL